MRCSINRPMVETGEIFLTIGDYDDRKSADAFPFYHAPLNRRALCAAGTSQRQNRQKGFTPWNFPNSLLTMSHFPILHIFSPVHTTLAHYVQLLENQLVG
jgi:hypothetical protein